MFYKWLEINWDMTFRMYPDVIVEETLPTYRSSNAVASIRAEMAKPAPSSIVINYWLNGDKYDQSIV